MSVWDDYNVSELYILAKARGEYVQREAWQHTSTLVATIANLFREKGKAAFQPTDFNPVYQAEQERITGKPRVRKPKGNLTRDQFLAMVGQGAFKHVKPR